MNETHEILLKYREARLNQTPYALATVVRLDGSSYRRPGAKMLITRDGEIAGTVSGGCLERDLILRAVRAIETGKSGLIRYDTRADADDDEAEARVKGAGLGCEGVIEIFLEPQAESHLLALEKAYTERTHGFFNVTLPDGSSFRDSLKPPMRLILFGAGHDSVSMWRLGQELGWEATVVDCHSAFPVARTNFEGVSRFFVSDPKGAVEKAEVDSESIVIVMTHNYEHDKEIVSNLLGRSPVYLGLLGPRVRSEKLLRELGCDLEALPKGLHYPLGLDIGGDTPASVALSALSEAQAVLSGREGGFLSRRPTPIHSD